MNNTDLPWHRGLVLAAALLYWGGVLVQARRVRRQIGTSPNLKPRGRRERLLWAGWALVIGLWIAQPLWLGLSRLPAFLQPAALLLHPTGFFAGVLLLIAGYAGTLWCYAAMGNAWRIGINRREKNTLIITGPFAYIRHPIYAFQVVMLLGAAFLLPTAVSIGIVLLHLFCTVIKASDEEAYLLSTHGQAYRDYQGRSGMLMPRLSPRNRPKKGLSGSEPSS